VRVVAAAGAASERAAMMPILVLALPPFVVALGLWMMMTAAEIGVAESRELAATANGPPRLGPLFDELHRHPRRLLIALSLGRELALAAVATIAAIVGWRERGLAGALIAVAVAVLLLALARGIAAGIVTRRVARGTGTIVPGIGAVLALLLRLAAAVKAVGRRAAHAIAGEEPTGTSLFARDEIAALSDGSEGELAESERALVAKAASFGDRPVRHVMTPRRDIIAVAADISSDELWRVIRSSGCSRIPVYRGERDDVVGILYVKDLIGPEGVAAEITPLLREPYVVPAEMTVGVLFREFRARKVHIALVVDEYGSLAGVVTMEDLLEELVGDIRDEFDEDEAPEIVRRGPSTFIVSGRTSVAALSARLKLDIRSSDADEATIAGVVIDRLGRVPDSGETVSMDGFTVTVEKLDGAAIERLRLDVWPSPSPA
jgi:putative hemolysin